MFIKIVVDISSLKTKNKTEVIMTEFKIILVILIIFVSLFALVSIIPQLGAMVSYKVISTQVEKSMENKSFNVARKKVEAFSPKLNFGFGENHWKIKKTELLLKINKATLVSLRQESS